MYASKYILKLYELICLVFFKLTIEDTYVSFCGTRYVTHRTLNYNEPTLFWSTLPGVSSSSLSLKLGLLRSAISCSVPANS